MTAMWEMDFIILNILRRKDERERERDIGDWLGQEGAQWITQK
jgi:hypothetical protein